MSCFPRPRASEHSLLWFQLSLEAPPSAVTSVSTLWISEFHGAIVILLIHLHLHHLLTVFSGTRWWGLELLLVSSGPPRDWHAASMVFLADARCIFVVLFGLVFQILSRGLTLYLWLAQTLSGDLAGLDLTEIGRPSTLSPPCWV